MGTRRDFLQLLSGTAVGAALPFRPLEPTTSDALTLAKGLSYRVIVSEGDHLNAHDVMGAACDWVGFVQLEHRDDGLLWVNNDIGGSIVRVQRGSGRWVMVRDDAFNRRVTQGIGKARGGAVTPWGTVLAAEADDGWTIEIDVKTGAAKRLPALGRYSHGGMALQRTADQRCVIYSGHARPFGCLFKFISDVPGSLEQGQLYVANFEAKRWEQLSRDAQPALAKSFKDPLDVQTRLQEAAYLVGGSRLDSPAGVAIDGQTGSVLVSCLGNPERRNITGHVQRLSENGGDLLALTFEVATVLAGGVASKPNDLTLDRAGNLFVTPAGEGNALYLVQSRDWHGPPQIARLATAPRGGRLTGQTLARDGSTLFLSVQPATEHSHWPFGGAAKARSSVIAVEGDLLREVATL
jgi:secreted PhoX family phosphatase